MWCKINGQFVTSIKDGTNDSRVDRPTCFIKKNMTVVTETTEKKRRYVPLRIFASREMLQDTEVTLNLCRELRLRKRQQSVGFAPQFNADRR